MFLWSMFMFTDTPFSLIFVHYSVHIFFDYCLVLYTMLSVHVLDCLSMVPCLYCYYCLCMVVSQAVLICLLIGLSLYVFVVGFRGIVKLWFVLALNVVCFMWLANLFCDANVAGSIMMFLIVFSFYSAMGPWSPIFSLNYCSRPYGNRNTILGVPWFLSSIFYKNKFTC